MKSDRVFCESGDRNILLNFFPNLATSISFWAVAVLEAVFFCSYVTTVALRQLLKAILVGTAWYSLIFIGEFTVKFFNHPLLLLNELRYSFVDLN